MVFKTISIISELTRPSRFLTIQSVTEEPGSCLTAGIGKGTLFVELDFTSFAKKKKIQKKIIAVVNCELWQPIKKFYISSSELCIISGSGIRLKPYVI